MGDSYVNKSGFYLQLSIRPGCKCSAVAAALTMSVACSGPMNAARNGTGFYCTVEGASYLPTSVDSAAICDLFKSRIDAQLPKPSMAVDSSTQANAPNWVKIEISVSKRDSIGAVLTQRIGAKETVHPEIVIDIMDKSLGNQELNRLADTVAQRVSGKVEK